MATRGSAGADRDHRRERCDPESGRDRLRSNRMRLETGDVADDHQIDLPAGNAGVLDRGVGRLPAELVLRKLLSARRRRLGEADSRDDGMRLHATSSRTTTDAVEETSPQRSSMPWATAHLAPP